MIILATIVAYLPFVLLKFGSTHLLTNDSLVVTDLIDWNDDRISQDKEFVPEINIFKSLIVTAFFPKNESDLKAAFFYNRIYKNIKISVITPPPKIG